MPNTRRYREGKKFSHITSGTNILRPTGQDAWLQRITVNTPAAGTITVYNNGAASGDVVAVLTLTTSDAGSFEYDFGLSNGLTLVLSVTMDITVVYE